MITFVEELILRILFLASFVLLIVVRGSYHRKAGTHKEKVVSETEGVLLGLVRLIVVIPFFGSILLFVLFPEWLYLFSLRLDFTIRMLGVLFIFLAVIGILWTNVALGKHFSTTLIVREDHELITTGPYTYIRHPMYSFTVLWVFGMYLVTDNWIFLLALPIFMVLIMGFRMVKEEEMLNKKFGIEYEEYKKRTKRFIPKII